MLFCVKANGHIASCMTVQQVTEQEKAKEGIKVQIEKFNKELT